MTGPFVNEAMMNEFPKVPTDFELNHLTTKLHETAFMQMA